jgi:hypothetical protein
MQIIKLFPKDLPKKNAAGRVTPKSKLKLIFNHSGPGPEKKRAKHPHIQTGSSIRKITTLNIPIKQLDFVFIKMPYNVAFQRARFLRSAEKAWLVNAISV